MSIKNYFIVFLVVFSSCSSFDEREVVEYYPDGTPELVITYKDSQDSICLAHYYENGQLHKASCFMNERLSGQVYSYNKNGGQISIINYQNGVREGAAMFFSANNNLDTLLYYVRGKKEYRALYNNTSERVKESFFYDFNIINDTIEGDNNSVEFEVSLMAPDSTTRDRKFYFSYELAPLSRKDSIIINPRDSILLSVNDTMKGEVRIDKRIPQILYGHLTFNDSVHIIHNPTDRTLYVK